MYNANAVRARTKRKRKRSVVSSEGFLRTRTTRLRQQTFFVGERMSNWINWRIAVVRHRELSSGAKGMALYLNTFMNDRQDFAWPSLTTISGEMNMARATAIKYLKELEAGGMLVKVNKVGKSNTYYATIPASAKSELVQELNQSAPKNTPQLVQDLNHTSSESELPLVQDLNPNKQSNKQENKQGGSLRSPPVDKKKNLTHAQRMVEDLVVKQKVN